MQSLTEHGLARFLSIGGAVGLSYYHQYRTTNDIDAWWESDTGEQDHQKVLQIIEQTLKRYGEVNRRTWGDVSSVELLREGKVVFSMQIALRSARLHPPVLIKDGGLWVDSFEDLVASKMVALVERGAPRDFRDIHALCTAELIAPAHCWQLWRQRQNLAGSDANPDRAKLAVETHLMRISLHRPLEKIVAIQQRDEAEKTRNWFADVFLQALRYV